MSQSVIAPDDVWALWAVVLVGVAVSIHLEQTYRWAARLSGPVIALLIAMFTSNVGLMPMSSPTYDVIGDYLVPVAVALLLFRADLVEILRTSRGAFVAMQIAVVATVLGSLLAGVVVSWFAAPPLSERLPEVGGLMAASYSGGGVNFFAVKQIYGIDDETTNSLLVADNLVMAAAFLVMFSLASAPFMRRLYPHAHSLEADEKLRQETPSDEASETAPARSITVLDIAASLAVAGAIAATSKHISLAVKAALVQPAASDVAEAKSLLWEVAASLAGSTFAWVTILSITVATLFRKPLARIVGADELGGYLLYVFLFSIGLPSDFMEVVRKVPLMFVLCLIIAAVNMLLTLGVGKLLRLNLEELLLATNASLGGPPTAAAMAVSLGWTRLVKPGLLIGLWGYIVGTALGVLTTEILRRWL